MKYVTIVAFTDKPTGDVYYVGDKYPAKGKAKKEENGFVQILGRDY